MTSTTTDQSKKNSRVLLLGASGQLGQMLRSFWPTPHDLVCHSRRPAPDFITFDLILEPEKARTAMEGISAVVCLSGVTGKRASSHGDVYSRNTDLALAAVRAASKAHVPRLFLTSSAAVYGASPGVQIETATSQPIGAYGRAKLEMEASAIQLARELGQKVTALRIGNVAGADAILGGWFEGMQLDQFPNGKTPARSYIGPQTLARVIARLCQALKLPSVLNIATPGVVEMGALLEAARLPWTPRPAQDSAIAKVELSTDQLERHVSFSPEDSTVAGLVREWAAYKTTTGNSK